MSKEAAAVDQQAAMERMMAMAMAKVMNGDVEMPASMSVREVAPMYWEYLEAKNKARGRELNAYCNARSKIGCLVEFFKDRPISDLDHSDVVKYRSWRRTFRLKVLKDRPAHVADSTIWCEVTMLMALINFACHSKEMRRKTRLTANPIENLDNPQPRASRSRVFYPWEREAMCATDKNQLRYMIRAVSNGLRPREVRAALRNQITLETIGPNDDGVIPGVWGTVKLDGHQTKTGVPRLAILDPRTTDALCSLDTWIEGAPQPLTNARTGREYTMAAFGIWWDEQREAIKLGRNDNGTRAMLYSMRHTLASRAHQAGVPPFTIAQVLGHASSNEEEKRHPSTKQLFESYLHTSVTELRKALSDVMRFEAAMVEKKT